MQITVSYKYNFLILLVNYSSDMSSCTRTPAALFIFKMKRRHAKRPLAIILKGLKLLSNINGHTELKASFDLFPSFKTLKGKLRNKFN